MMWVGVPNLILPSATPPLYEAYLDAIINSGVKVLENAGSNPKEFFVKTKNAGIIILHNYTSVRHALSSERNGVYIISIDGFECAAFRRR